MHIIIKTEDEEHMAVDNFEKITYDKPFEQNRKDILDYLKSKLGLDCVDEKTLETVSQAFTTPGYAREHGVKDYNRLEFLGDAFIRYHISKCIFELYPDMDEGRMSKLCHYLWNDKTYPECVRKSNIAFFDLILVPKSEKNQQ